MSSSPPRADGQSRLIVHSTTPIARGFETDLTAMVEGRPVSDLTTYVETRGLYLARSGDLVVGRTRPWRLAIAKQGVRRLRCRIPTTTTCRTRCSRRAVDAGDRDPVLARIIEFLRERPSAVVSPYDFEPEFQILVTWLAQAAGLTRIRVDANNSRLGAWNGKRMLHPTVELCAAAERPGVRPTGSAHLGPGASRERGVSGAADSTSGDPGLYRAVAGEPLRLQP